MKNLTKLIYLASPYSYKINCSSDSRRCICKKIKKQEEKYRYILITKIAGKLQDRFPYAFILPITMSHNTARYMKTKGGGFEHWETIDFTYISKCDEVWVVTMNGWKESIGVMKEIEFATKNKIPIQYYDFKLDSFINDDVKDISVFT